MFNKLLAQMGYNICHYGNLWRNIAGFERWEVGVKSDEKFRSLFSPFKPMYFLFLALNSLPSVFAFYYDDFQMETYALTLAKRRNVPSPRPP